MDVKFELHWAKFFFYQNISVMPCQKLITHFDFVLATLGEDLILLFMPQSYVYEISEMKHFEEVS